MAILLKVEFPKNLSRVYRGEVTVAMGLTTLFFELDPKKNATVMILKDGETVTLDASVDTKQKSPTPGSVDAGAPLAEVDDSDIMFFNVSSGSTDYFAGDDRPLSILKMVTTPVTNPVKYSVVQNQMPTGKNYLFTKTQEIDDHVKGVDGDPDNEHTITNTSSITKLDDSELAIHFNFAECSKCETLGGVEKTHSEMKTINRTWFPEE